MNDEKNIEIVSGDGSNLEISPVYDHINTGSTHKSTQKPKNIVVPKELNEKDKKNKDKTKDEKK